MRLIAYNALVQSGSEELVGLANEAEASSLFVRSNSATVTWPWEGKQFNVSFR